MPKIYFIKSQKWANKTFLNYVSNMTKKWNRKVSQIISPMFQILQVIETMWQRKISGTSSYQHPTTRTWWYRIIFLNSKTLPKSNPEYQKLKKVIKILIVLDFNINFQCSGTTKLQSACWDTEAHTTVIVLNQEYCQYMREFEMKSNKNEWKFGNDKRTVIIPRAILIPLQKNFEIYCTNWLCKYICSIYNYTRLSRQVQDVCE